MERIVTFDNIRGLCVLWIVGFWHMIGYWQINYQLSQSQDSICQIITWTTLAAFTYISGYFLGNKKISSFKDACSFYRKRLKRFYPLFFLSCITLFLAGIILSKNGIGQMWFPKTSDFFLSIIGLSTYIGNPPATLWYFCMLMSFYLITPLFLLSEKKTYRGFVGILLLSFLIFLEFIIGSDYRNSLYFPFYIFGILKILDPKRIPKWIYGIAVIFYIIACFYQAKYGKIDNSIFIIFESFIGVILLIWVCDFIFHFAGIANKLLALLSYSSMTAYLFHRQICGLFKVILPSDIVTPWMTTFLYIPIVFVCGYLIQKIYDSLIK